MSKNLRFMCEGAVMLALALVLSRIKIMQMPQGGSVTPGSMIPILFIAYRWGLKKGILISVLYGAIQMGMGATKGYVVSPVQGFLDYIFAFGALGLVGLVSDKLKRLDGAKSLKLIIGSTLVVIAIRYACHVLAGVVFFSEYAGTQNPWIYSLAYNSFLIPEFVIAVVALALVWNPITRNIRQVD